MKLMLLIMIFFPISGYAKIYKCKVEGKKIYQDKKCSNIGASGEEFKKHYDISLEQQQAAKENLMTELAEREKEKRLKKAIHDKERRLRAQETTAGQAVRHARAAEKRNVIEKNKPVPVINIFH